MNSEELGAQTLGRSWCLVTDIDGTLIGETDSTRALRARVLREKARLAAMGKRLYWVIATGRTLPSCQEVLIEQGFSLSDFDALVTSVGAELHVEVDPAARTAYHARLASTGFDAERVRDCLAHLALQLQAEEEQHPHKVSYWVQDSPTLRAALDAALARLHFETHVGFSHDNYLDVAPSNGAKGGAVAHLLEYWGIEAHDTVAAGDSGNDLSMLQREWHAIVVGNGHDQLAMLRGQTRVFFATAKHAAGILEGLGALGFLSAPI